LDLRAFLAALSTLRCPSYAFAGDFFHVVIYPTVRSFLVFTELATGQTQMGDFSCFLTKKQNDRLRRLKTASLAQLHCVSLRHLV
jgi:hypothetical protein